MQLRYGACTRTPQSAYSADRWILQKGASAGRWAARILLNLDLLPEASTNEDLTACGNTAAGVGSRRGVIGGRVSLGV